MISKVCLASPLVHDLVRYKGKEKTSSDVKHQKITEGLSLNGSPTTTDFSGHEKI